MEKERTLTVHCRKNGWTDVCGELEEYEKVLEEERNMTLQNQLVKIHNGVRKFQRQLKDVKPTPECKNNYMHCNKNIVNNCPLRFSVPRSFEELLKEERTCRQEITAYEKKIENWSLKSDPKLPTTPTVRVSPKPPDRDLPAEVRALEAFLQKTGGPYGGWDQYDHQAFLKVWTKHSGLPAYRKEAKLYLPGKSLEEIEQHEDWHQELIYLQDRKREVENLGTLTLIRTVFILYKHDIAKRSERAFIFKRLWRYSYSVLVCTYLYAYLCPQQILTLPIKMISVYQEERRRQLEVKLTIEEQLRLRREEEEEQGKRRREEEQREMDERRREAAKGIKHFNERVRSLRVTEKKVDVYLFVTQVDGHVSRDPSRLTRPTKGWEERMKYIGPSGGGPVLQMFHRAVPTWREGL
uniref:Coiled-coil domain containing 112 n=1 Tax=Seriola lalandi dorsalis TaxID=1841481 RepID=A0A3B4YWA7_SERLL